MENIPPVKMLIHCLIDLRGLLFSLPHIFHLPPPPTPQKKKEKEKELRQLWERTFLSRSMALLLSASAWRKLEQRTRSEKIQIYKHGNRKREKWRNKLLSHLQMSCSPVAKVCCTVTIEFDSLCVEANGFLPLFLFEGLITLWKNYIV